MTPSRTASAGRASSVDCTKHIATFEARFAHTSPQTTPNLKQLDALDAYFTWRRQGTKAKLNVRGGSKMELKRSGTQPSGMGAEANFTGNVRIDPLFGATVPARASGALVTFEPGARSAWHFHPLGQTLIVTQGCGWVQSEGGPKIEIRAGDVVSCPPKERHWHGATSTTGVSHIAIQEALDGKVVEWLEKVTDEEYLAQSDAA